MIMTATATPSGVMGLAFLVRAGETFPPASHNHSGKMRFRHQALVGCRAAKGVLPRGSGGLEAVRPRAVDPARQLPLIQCVGFLEADGGFGHERVENLLHCRITVGIDAKLRQAV